MRLALSAQITIDIKNHRIQLCWIDSIDFTFDREVTNAIADRTRKTTSQI